MSTELFERKIRTLFSRFDIRSFFNILTNEWNISSKRFDIDKSGSIEESDFDQWGDKLISYGTNSKIKTLK